MPSEGALLMAGRKKKRRAAPRRKNTGERVDVLCQCGWGRLACPVNELPAACPVCGYAFAQDPVEASEVELGSSLSPALGTDPRAAQCACGRLLYPGEVCRCSAPNPPLDPSRWRRNESAACAYPQCPGEPMSPERCEKFGYKPGLCFKHQVHGLNSCSVNCCGIKGHPGECDPVSNGLASCGNPPIDLSAIRVLWRQPDTMALWGVPYDMRPNQSPYDLVRAEWPGKMLPGQRSRDVTPDKRSGEVPPDWIWLGSPGWWGHLSPEDRAAIERFLAQVGRDMIPQGPAEFVSLGAAPNPSHFLHRCFGCGRDTAMPYQLCSTCTAPRRKNPGHDLKPGDRVKYRAAFLQSTGQYTGVPDYGVVVEGSGGMDPTRFVRVRWRGSDTATPVNVANIMRADKPDYSGMNNNPRRTMIPRSTRGWWPR